MLLYKIGLAIGVFLILVTTAWVSAHPSTDLNVTYSLIALMAYGLELADGTTMGFVFIILALPHLSWMETLLMVSSAQMILSMVRRDRADPKTMLQSLGANAAAVLVTQGVYHAPSLERFEEPIRLMLDSGACFLTLRILDVKRWDVWAFPYYPVAAAITALFPVGAALPPLVYLAWRSCRRYEKRLKAQRECSREAASLHLRTIETLALAIEARDQPASRNSRRVQVYAVEMAKEMAIPETLIEAVRAASLLYDIGEMAVPENIILKPGPLTPDEYEKVKIHPAVGADILERVRFPYPVAPIVLAHHERWDGAGYPNGLSGDAIPVGARILAVVDAFDALISARHHRGALAVDEALAQLSTESGKAYDPRMVELLKNRHAVWEKRATSEPQRGFIESILSAQNEVKVVLELSRQLGSSLDLNDTYDALKPSLRSLIPFETMAVWIERDGHLIADFVAGDHLSLLASLRIPLGGGVSGVVASTQKPLVNGDAAKELGNAGLEPGFSPFRIAISIPLDLCGICGALTLYRSSDDKFTAEDARVLAALGPKIATAIANGLKFRNTSAQASTDSLTGLPNASALFSRFDASVPAVVLICDLDGFKGVNDRFGHLTGNRLLEGLAAGFRRSCRSGDFVARMGGDEFVLLLEHIDPAEIGARIMQFREMIRAVGREICGEDILDASFGAAFSPTDGATANELLACADQQMYRRKEEHRAGVLKMQKSA